MKKRSLFLLLLMGCMVTISLPASFCQVVSIEIKKDTLAPGEQTEVTISVMNPEEGWKIHVYEIDRNGVVFFNDTIIELKENMWEPGLSWRINLPVTAIHNRGIKWMEDYLIAAELSFPEAPFCTISGYKFNDKNGNEIWDQSENELGIYNVEILLEGPEGTIRTKTDPDGKFEFKIKTPGYFTLREIAPAGWRPTRPDSIVFFVSEDDREGSFDFYFGNQAEGESEEIDYTCNCGNLALRSNSRRGNQYLPLPNRIYSGEKLPATRGIIGISNRSGEKFRAVFRFQKWNNNLWNEIANLRTEKTFNCDRTRFTPPYLAITDYTYDSDRYRVLFHVNDKTQDQAGCCRDTVNHEFEIVKLEVKGPDEIFIFPNPGGGQIPAKGLWSLQSSSPDDALDGAKVKWWVHKQGSVPPIFRNKDQVPTPPTAEWTAEEEGNYYIRFRYEDFLGEEREVTKNFRVTRIGKIQMEGPEILCLKPDPKDNEICSERDTITPRGIWRITVEPPLEGISCRHTRRDVKNTWVRVDNIQGNQYSYPPRDQKKILAGYHKITFLKGEQILGEIECLILNMDIDVVVDGTLDGAGSPEEIPIYVETSTPRDSFHLPIKISHGFRMRFRVTTSPAVAVHLENKNSGDKGITLIDPDPVFRNRGDLQNFDPLNSRVEYFQLTPKENNGNGRIQITVENMSNHKRHPVGRIEVKSGQTKVVPVHVYYVNFQGNNGDSELLGLNQGKRRTIVNNMFRIANTYWSQFQIRFKPDFRGELKSNLRLGKNGICNEDQQNQIKASVNTIHNLFFVQRVDQNRTAYTHMNLSNFAIFFNNPGTRGNNGTVLAHEFLHGTTGFTVHSREDCYLDQGEVNFDDGIIRQNQGRTARSNVGN